MAIFLLDVHSVMYIVESKLVNKNDDYGQETMMGVCHEPSIMIYLNYAEVHLDIGEGTERTKGRERKS